MRDAQALRVPRAARHSRVRPAAPRWRSCCCFPSCRWRKRRLPRQSACRARTPSSRARSPNGMKIIVWPDHDIPNVVLYNWVRVGSPQRAPGHHRALALLRAHDVQRHEHARAGRVRPRDGSGRRHATTPTRREDVTVYQDWFPRSALELIFDLESDRMRNLAFDPQGRRERARRRVLRAALARRQRQRRHARRAGAGDGLRRAPLPDSRSSAGRPTSSPGRWRTCKAYFTHLLRAEQLHARRRRRRAPGGDLRARRARTSARSRRSPRRRRCARSSRSSGASAA